MHRTLPATLLIACCSVGYAGPYDPPAGEYTAVDTAVANATPASLTSDLRTALRTLTSAASHVSYQNGRFRYDESDLDLDNPGNLIVIYSGASISSTWDSGATWNREHTWPSSHMQNNSSGSLEYTDFHQLRPCFSSVNSSRGNKPFGQTGSNSGGLWDPGFDTRGGTLYSFDPQDRGEIARTMFYMATRHDNTLVNCTSSSQLANGQMGDLATLLRWHYEHPADEREFFRNDVIDDSIQFNRNPFVDRNEYVWAIWGTSPNDSQIVLDGLTAPDGSTSETIDLGDVIVGNNFPVLSRGIIKTGTTPTTYRVYTTGDAINDLTDVTFTPVSSGAGSFSLSASTDDWRGRCLAFPYGPQSHTSTLTGLTLLDTDTPGDRLGTVVIDNTDLTSAGTGAGSADGDDVITLTGRVVEHSEASFDSESNVDVVALDFGTVTPGAFATQVVTIGNLPASSGFTAGLRITGITGVGDTEAFDLGDLTTLEHLAGGETSDYILTMVATEPGQYAATFTIAVADDPIPGAVVGDPLLLVLTAEVEAGVPCPADIDADGDVDLGDFGIFGAAFGALAGDANYNPAVDFDNDGDVDLGDFGIFGGDFGRTDCPL
ncbi:MAG: hypothetical protein Tsb0013_15650 [Phycisphaerales bacterium]